MPHVAKPVIVTMIATNKQSLYIAGCDILVDLYVTITARAKPNNPVVVQVQQAIADNSHTIVNKIVLCQFIAS